MSPFTVGLTGGVASGKSEAAKAFAALGVPVVDADELARTALAPGSPVLARLTERLGTNLLDASGALDRSALRHRIFTSARERREVEAVVHPEVRRRLEETIAATTGPYLVAVVPLLVEIGLGSRFDRILVIDSPERLQVERLIRRDGETEVSARRMLAAQADRAARVAVADDVIVNGGTLQELTARIQTLHQRYLADARACASSRR